VVCNAFHFFLSGHLVGCILQNTTDNQARPVSEGGSTALSSAAIWGRESGINASTPAELVKRVHGLVARGVGKTEVPACSAAYAIRLVWSRSMGRPQTGLPQRGHGVPGWKTDRRAFLGRSCS
jgi:hypothetical protein